ncbi:MAG: hypothetical protein HN712_25625, partial [Gemmatimonadetes bacterium]|nr:hypothetical protein [Gemmatimonadota bacterium]
MSNDRLSIRGLSAARYGVQDLDLPLRQLVCLRGGSGSGAHALARDVLLGESRRRFLRALSPQERERFGGLGSPVEMEEVTGLPAAQPLPGVTSQRRVLDVLHLRADLSRILRACARTFCPDCGGICRRLDDDEAARMLQEEEAIHDRCLVIAPLSLSSAPADATAESPESGRIPDSVFDELVRAGFPRVLVEGEVLRIDSDDSQGRSRTAATRELLVVVDRLIPATAPPARLGEAIRNARAMGHGRTFFQVEGEEGQRWFNRQYSCCVCGRQIDEPAWNRWLEVEDASVLRAGVSNTRFTDREVGDLAQWRLDELDAMLHQLSMAPGGDLVQLLARMRAFLACALKLDLGHLPLWRHWDRLAFGERLRLSIAVAQAQRLSGLLYIIDVPLSGLWVSTGSVLVRALRELIGHGSSVVVVDADPSICEQADVVVELAVETEDEWPSAPPSLTRDEPERVLILRPREGRIHDGPLDPNLQLDIPLGLLVCIDGPSGSGKSALLRQIHCGLPGGATERSDYAVDGTGLRRCIDLSRQGVVPDGTTLMQLLMLSRDLARLFAGTPSAQERQIPAESFELERPGGRCAVCEGRGEIVHRLEYVEDLVVVCPECEGRRFREEIFEATLRGATLADLLEMSVGEAARFLHRERRPNAILQAAAANGLSRLPLATAANHLDPPARLRALLAGYTGRADHRDLFVVERPGAGEDGKGAHQLHQGLRRLVATGATVMATRAASVMPEMADWLV